MTVLVMVVVSLSLLAIPSVSQINAQDNANKLTTYENPILGIGLSYPSTWALGKLDEDKECPDVCSEVWQLLDRRDAPFPDGTLSIQVYNFEGPTISEKCNCNSLNELVLYRYNETQNRNNFSLINENNTEISKNYSAQQFEYLSGSYPPKVLKIFTRVNNTFYEISYSAFDEQLYSKVLPQVMKVMDSIEFFPSEALGQNQTAFVTYENTALGFSIERPLGWHNRTMIDPRDVMFFKSSDSPLPQFSIQVRDVARYLDTETLTVKNKTLDQVIGEYLTNVSNPLFKPIRQNQTVVGGNPGWKFEATTSLTPEREMEAYLFNVLTVANGRVFSFGYAEEPLKVPESLPIANKMLDSFRVIPVEPPNTLVEPLNTSSVRTNLTEGPTEETFELSSKTPAKQGTASMTVYNITKNATSSKDTLGYTSLYERVEKPRTFTPEQQAMIDESCKSLKNNYSSLSVEDRNWYLANC